MTTFLTTGADGVFRPFMQPNQTHACPCLGTNEDSQTAMAFATMNNRCYRAEKPCEISLQHQDRICLSKSYRHCVVFHSAETPPPVDPPHAEENLLNALLLGAKREVRSVTWSAAAISKMRERPQLPSAETLPLLAALKRPHLRLLFLIGALFVMSLVLLGTQLGW